MLRLNTLIAENHDLLLHEDIDNLIKEFFVQLFGQAMPVMATPNLLDKACISSGIESALLRRSR